MIILHRSIRSGDVALISDCCGNMSPKLLPELTARYGLTVIMYPNDHRPAHVHIYRGENVARISIETENPTVIDCYGFRKRDLNNICELLEPHRDGLIVIWNEMHPDIPVE